MAEEWPKLLVTKTTLRRRRKTLRKKGIALHVGGLTIKNNSSYKFNDGMTIRSHDRLSSKICMVMHNDRITAPWDKDGDVFQMIYRSRHMFVFKHHCINLIRDYWTGRCSLSLLNKADCRIIKRISFADQYFPPKRQRAKQRLLQRTFNRYLKLV